MGKRIIEIKSKTGTVYLYEDVSYRDKKKGYSTHARTCIGKVGADGKPIYNKYYNAREQIQELSAEAEKLKAVSSTTFVGETLVLDKVLGYSFSRRHHFQFIIILYLCSRKQMKKY
ncbi:MAG: hypothetical protein LBK58_05220 [Prevotellaceae bacterium]|jgi:hypothetical protein|nr:hypothetical protein [Prevotellaceae bacterium]